MEQYVVVVTKSTVPIGTANKVKAAVQEKLNKPEVNIPFDVASNPELLKKSATIDDFLKPGKIVIETESEKVIEVLSLFYLIITLLYLWIYYQQK